MTYICVCWTRTKFSSFDFWTYSSSQIQSLKMIKRAICCSLNKVVTGYFIRDILLDRHLVRLLKLQEEDDYDFFLLLGLL